jgi:hypothetical protein
VQPRLVAISDELHQRVQRFAAGESAETFEALALSLAHFQTQASPGFRRLLQASGRQLQGLDDIPAVPTEAFRLSRVATFPAELEQLRFFTSGTTGSARGEHAMRRADTYEQLSLAFGRQALLPAHEGAGPLVMALAPAPSVPPTSSLGYMMARFMESFDGQPLDSAEAAFDVAAPARWLFSERGVDLPGLMRAVQAARARQQPLLLLGTAFALVQLRDDLAGTGLPLPPGSLVMQTGGFKGRTREVSMAELRAGLSRAFALEPARIVGEYGMTELTSQLYEATVGESALAQRHPGAPAGRYFEPPWLRVTPVDPLSLEPVANGEVGLARFIDLGNVDSAVCVVTQDLVRRVGGGIELLGRQLGATPRGCSLSIEALLHG